MRRQRFGDVRTRSPPRAKIRDRAYSPPRRDIQERHSRFVSGSVASGRGERGSGLVDRHFDGDRDGQMQKLSQFNEGLSRVESPSMKFQWKHLLAEPSNLNGNANPDLKQVTSYGASRMSTEMDYQGSRFSGLGGHETVVTKPMSVEIERARTFSLQPLDVGLAKNSGRVDGRFPSPLQKSNVGTYNDEDLRIQDTLRVDKLLARELYKEEEKPMFYSKDASHYMMPTSQSETLATLSSGITKSNFPGSYNDGLYITSGRMCRTREVLTEPTGYDGYSRTTHFESSTMPELQVRDMTNYWRVQLSPTKGKPGDYTYPEVRRSERGDLGTLSDELCGNIYTYPEVRRSERGDLGTLSDELCGNIYTYPEVRRSERGDLGTLSDELCGKMASVREDYGHRDTLRTSIVDSIVDRIDVTESYRGDHLRESMLSEHLLCLQEQPISNYHDVSGASYSLKQDGEVLGSTSTHLDFATEVYPDHENWQGTEVYRDHENLHFKEDNGFERDGGPWSYEENLNRLPMSECDPDLYRIDGSPNGRLTTEELGLRDLSEKILKRKRSMDKKMSRHKPKSKLSSDWNASHNIHDLSDGNEQLTGEDMDCAFFSNKSGHSQYRKAVGAFDEMASHRIPDSDDLLPSRNLSVSMQRRLSKHHIPAGRDIQKRLRPGPHNILNPSLRNRKPYKFPKKRLNHFHGSLHAPRGDPSEAKVIPVKTDPPEDSEEFKQLVYSAFLKFVKQLNESPAQRRRYTEQGKAGSLKCSICGSDSKEFVDPESLAMHAFKSIKIGFRAWHLGFHKALCMLMGWNSAVAPNRSWVRLVLPDAEALALKEDLIIWPPIVIIQNSSIGNNDPDERMIVTIEVLETILRDMGFGGGKTKVCRGKPANQSIMVVKFNGTFSGLQDAEKLHKFYAENKHGRAEFQQISSDSGNSSSGESRKMLIDKAEHVLYGYLGITGDLDKLDFETKKRSVVKSKKEIQAIADAPIKTE